jgi:hypothetical protein
MDAKEKSFVFVNYISRSGSTFLCRLLDEYADVAVGIEAGFPGAIHRLIPEQYETIADDQSLHCYLDELFADIRFKEWKIDRQVLLKKLQAGGYPLNFKDILHHCMLEYFEETPSPIFVHKAGYYIDILEDVQKTFGEAKNIFVMRDPRAIFNSQKNARCLYSGKLMGHSLPYFVWQFRKRAKIVEQNRKNKNLYCVHYEKLIENTAEVMAEILDFLGVHAAKKDVASGYADRIPENQQQLHTNVKSDPNRNSLAKWKQGLQKHEVLFIQHKLGREMAAMNYTPLPVRGLGIKGWYDYLRTELKYLILQIKMLR